MKKVFIGLSGGVDSAVSAALLRDAGYAVTGVFIKIWQPEFIECTWREDRLDAMRVAATLGIPFREIDLSSEYKKSVIDEMMRAYQAGLTPNPDVLCNTYVKFGVFAAWAFAHGAQYIATGHYAQVLPHEDGLGLFRGADTAKDQSYFLHQLDGALLDKTLFPIGGMRKDAVRARAENYGLPNAAKPDSQGLCFVGDVSIPKFLERYFKTEQGTVLSTSGKAIGTHEGAVLYTRGQRHGFMVRDATEPYYVVATDMHRNTITVSKNREDADQLSITLSSMHWINTQDSAQHALQAQSRYREAPVDVLLDGNTCTFKTPHLVSPGQSLVLYDGLRCCGGGIIA